MSPRTRRTEDAEPETIEAPPEFAPDPPPDPPTVTAERKAPAEWRILKGTRASHFACARQLHGWRLHEHHQGEPIQITEAAYDEAIAAGQKMPCTPSPNAVSPHLGKGL